MGFAASLFLSDPETTDRLGRAIAAALKPGDTLLLEGQIGAGKTHLARAIIQNLTQLTGGPPTDVPSPTYTLVQTYDFPDTRLWHADLYRLGDASELAELGLDDAMGTDIVLIEWPDRLDIAPAGALKISLSVEDQGRRVSLTSTSDRWAALGAIDEQIDA